MAIRTREEIIAQLNTIFGDNNSDDVLNIMTDISDTLGNGTDAIKVADLERQLQEQDENWRKRYRDAFLSGPDDEVEPEEVHKPRRFEDLFKTN